MQREAFEVSVSTHEFGVIEIRGRNPFEPDDPQMRVFVSPDQVDSLCAWLIEVRDGLCEPETVRTGRRDISLEDIRGSR